MNKVQWAGCVEPVLVLMGSLLRAERRVVDDFYKMTNDVMIFSRIWTVGGVLCSVGEDDELFLNV